MNTVFLALAFGAAASAQHEPAPGHWPQWRGPNRDNVSAESGLLKEWPAAGPRLLWRIRGLGEGVGGVAVAGGLVFLTGYREEREFLTALDGQGRTVWSVPIGPAAKEDKLMRWLSQRTPTVDDDRVYAFTAGGILWCVTSREGRTLWKKDYATDLGGVKGPWGGFCDFPLVDGGKLICTPGGPKATMVALDKKTGDRIWTCAVPECKGSTFSSVIACQTGSEKVYVNQLDAGTVAVSRDAGRRRWFFPFRSSWDSNVHVAVPWKNDTLLTLSGWKNGCALLEFKQTPEGPGVAARYSEPHSFDGWFCTSLRLGDHLWSFENRTTCMEIETGKILLEERTAVRRPTVTSVAGLIYARGERGEVVLLEVDPGGMKTRGRFDLPSGPEPAWTFPVVAGGRLYLRDHDVLSCYDVRGPDYKEPPRPWNVLARELSKLPTENPTAPARSPAHGHWSQWRGPNRDNVSAEEGLLKEWPANGPRLHWKVQGLGEGVGGVAVAGGLVFLFGYRENKEFVTALDGNGSVVWSVPIGPAVQEMNQMRWLSQRTPTVDDDRLYAFTAAGVLLCLKSSDGSLLWTKHYARDFKGESGRWGYCDFPLVDGDRLVCTPGGPEASLVALNKKTGVEVWRAKVPNSKRGTHSAAVICDLDGVRQIVHQLDCGIVGIEPSTGRTLWFWDLRVEMGNVHVAVPYGKSRLLAPCGWGVGCRMLEISREQELLKVAEVYHQKLPLASWRSSSLRVGDQFYSFDGGLVCMELQSGQLHPRSGVGSTGGTVTHADGMFYLRGMTGEMYLVEANGENARVRSRFTAPERRETTWTFPVVAGGRLYLRDQGDLYSYSVAGEGFKPVPPAWDILGRVAPGPARPNPGNPAAALPQKREREPDAIFVPTPPDVVEKMLALAGTTRDDVVYDLGSGDGRIVIAASQRYGCRAVGFEIDPDLIKSSRQKIVEAGLEGKARIDSSDLFTVDLSGATVVTLYLGEKNNARLLPQLGKLKPGARIVSHAHGLGPAGPKPEQTVTMVSSDDGVEHTIHLWTIPLKKGKE